MIEGGTAWSIPDLTVLYGFFAYGSDGLKISRKSIQWSCYDFLELSNVICIKELNVRC